MKLQNPPNENVIPCTQCDSCVPVCPQRINIPGVFGALNDFASGASEESARERYRSKTRDGLRAKDCIACGYCEEICPQKIPIIAEINNASMIFDGK